MKKGIIFDMDGTLWDSAANVAESWNIAVKDAGYEREPITAEDMYRVMGRTMDKIADILFDNLDKKARMEILECCCKVENDYLRQHGGMLYPKVPETLSLLKKNYHLYIVSNCQSGYIEAFLDYYQLWELFDDIECFGNNKKPKGENIAEIYKRNRLEQAVYVGDIQGDYDATMESGLPFIHAAYGFGTINQPVPSISSFEDLPEVVKKVL